MHNLQFRNAMIDIKISSRRQDEMQTTCQLARNDPHKILKIFKNVNCCQWTNKFLAIIFV